MVSRGLPLLLVYTSKIAYIQTLMKQQLSRGWLLDSG